MKYNVSQLLIEYKNDKEYRETLRKIFQMKPVSTDTVVDDADDEITADENDYDCQQINTTMEQLFKETENHPLFQTLYDLAAAKMISLDRTIGQCVLFSYDYFYLFHACMCVFLVCPQEWTEECEYYRDLKTKLETR